MQKKSSFIARHCTVFMSKLSELCAVQAVKRFLNLGPWVCSQTTLYENWSKALTHALFFGQKLPNLVIVEWYSILWSKHIQF